MEAPAVTAPPEAVFQKIAAGGGRRGRTNDVSIYRSFYKKYIDVKGMPVVASGEVADEALQRTYTSSRTCSPAGPTCSRRWSTTARASSSSARTRSIPTCRSIANTPNPLTMNERVRGTGGLASPASARRTCSTCRSTATTTRASASTSSATPSTAPCAPLKPGLDASARTPSSITRDKRAVESTYAGSNPAEYWAEICKAYFDCNRVNNWNHGPVGTREQLKEYDPKGYELVRTAFKLTPENDWRYIPWQRSRASLRRPPEFKIDPYYTKFTWAREFPVLGRSASDEALLKANDTIRKMFAYRHDILKALIADGAKLVVLGRGERLSDLPEFKNLHGATNFDLAVRMCDYSPATRTLVIGEENVAGQRPRSVSSAGAW